MSGRRPGNLLQTLHPRRVADQRSTQDRRRSASPPHTSELCPGGVAHLRSMDLKDPSGAAAQSQERQAVWWKIREVSEEEGPHPVQLLQWLQAERMPRQ